MPPLKTGRGLSEMGWILTQGDRVTISNYRDKVLVLDLYATWCMPCRESIPHLVDLQKRYGPDGLAIVGLNVGGPDDRVAVPAFAREFRITYTLGFPERELSDLLLSDSDAIPQTFVFNRQGQLTRRFIGYGESTASELEGTIRSAINTRGD
jgi:thiol-disulfide isomerase/thioredoxin